MVDFRMRNMAFAYQKENPNATLAAAWAQGYMQAQKDIREQELIVSDVSFEMFWKVYDKKVGKPQAIRMWNKLTKTQHKKIMDNLHMYIQSTPDKQYRMNPATYLNPKNERWNDEIITNPNNTETKEQRLAAYAMAIHNTGREG